MPKRKKNFSFNQLIIIAALVVGIWIAADYYLNVYRHPQPETSSEGPVSPAPEPATLPAAVTVEEEPVLEDGFKLIAYRAENGKFEFQYPVFAQPDPACPSLKNNGNGFDLGTFSFVVSDGRGEISDFIDSELQGMDIDKTENITVAGQSATRIDYQTQGMGWNGSDVFLVHGGKFYEFGVLANMNAETCGGVTDYGDRVYRSVISTLKFTD